MPCERSEARVFQEVGRLSLGPCGASSGRASCGRGALRWTRSHEPLGLAAVASTITSTWSRRALVARAADEPVHLAVASAEDVVAGAAVERVAALVDLAIGPGMHVATGQRPQRVVAVAAGGDVLAEVGEDRVVAGPAALAVVAAAAGHPVAAVLAEGDVVAAATGDPVARVTAVQGVVARAAEDAVERREVAGGVGVAADGVVARAAVEPVVALDPAQRVVAGTAEDAVVARAAREPVVAGQPEDAVVAGVAVDHVGGARAPQALAAGAALDRGGERGRREQGEGGDRGRDGSAVAEHVHAVGSPGSFGSVRKRRQ